MNKWREIRDEGNHCFLWRGEAMYSSYLLTIRRKLFVCVATTQLGPGCVIVDVCGSHKLDTHTHTHIQSVGLLWTKDRLVATAAIYITHDRHKRRKSIPSAELEPATPAIKRQRTYTLDDTAAKIGFIGNYCPWNIRVFLRNYFSLLGRGLFSESRLRNLKSV
jgi:hypothetical protein